MTKRWEIILDFKPENLTSLPHILTRDFTDHHNVTWPQYYFTLYLDDDGILSLHNGLIILGNVDQIAVDSIISEIDPDAFNTDESLDLNSIILFLQNYLQNEYTAHPCEIQWLQEYSY